VAQREVVRRYDAEVLAHQKHLHVRRRQRYGHRLAMARRMEYYYCSRLPFAGLDALCGVTFGMERASRMASTSATRSSQEASSCSGGWSDRP
jgi:hypothetical protein